MSQRLAFQTQLASIMEVLANTAVAEICKLVDDGYAVVTLQMSQVQKENKALKRKLHLLELKMARGAAERRLRESHGNSGRLRVMVSGAERLRDTEPSTDGVFNQPVSWPHRSDTAGVTESERPQSKSPDVQFVEPEPVIIKEETKMETKEEVVHLIEDNGILESSPLVPYRPPPPQHDPTISTQTQTTRRRNNSAANRRVEEEEPDVVLVKVEEAEEMTAKSRSDLSLSVQEGLVESSTDDFRSTLPFADASPVPTNQLEESSQELSEVSFGPGSLWSPNSLLPPVPGPSSAYSPADPFSNLHISNVLSGHLPPELLTSPPQSKKRAKVVRKKTCACDFCDKRFSSPANLESHLRTHTGEKPFACNVCGKLFSQFWNMKIHKNIHTGERPYQCSVCKEKFSDPSNLKKHEKRHFAQNHHLNHT